MSAALKICFIVLGIFCFAYALSNRFRDLVQDMVFNTPAEPTREEQEFQKRIRYSILDNFPSEVVQYEELKS